MDLLTTGPDTARATLLLAHGAGAPMDNDWMNKMAAGLGKAGLRVIRFEFAYMAARRQGERRPPPKAERVMGEYRDAVAAATAEGVVSGPLFIGGKSMGGRVASMVAQELFDAGKLKGLVCLGYPFHPPEKPAELRTAHLERLSAPALICQGTRDPFGTREEVPGYALSRSIELFWLEDGDHDLKPRKAISGLSFADNLGAAIGRIAQFTGA